MTILALWLAGVAAVQAPVPVPDPPACGSCRIVLSRVTTLAGGVPPLWDERTPPGVVRTGAGLYLVAPSGDPAMISVHGPAGEARPPVGRAGSGPGEFRSIGWIVPWTGDSVLVIDRANRRLSLLTPGLRVARSFPLPGMQLFGAAALPGGELLLQGTAGAPGARGQVIHAVDPRGRLTASFGARAGSPAPGTSLTDQLRVIWPDSGGTVWSARPNTYEIEEWSPRGELLRTMTRAPAWFRPWAPTAQDDREGPRLRTGITAIRTGAGGLLWVFLTEPVPGARVRARSAPAPGQEGGVPPGYRELQALYRTVIEVLDPSTGRLVTSRVLDGWYFAGMPGDFVYRLREAASGTEQIEIWKLELCCRDDAGSAPSPAAALQGRVPERAYQDLPRAASIPAEGPGYSLAQPRSATLMPDGGVALVERADATVLRFSATGRFVGRYGARGGGPGEFQRPMVAGTRGDSLVVWDGALARVTVLAPNGALVRTHPIRGSDAGLLLPDGRVATISVRGYQFTDLPRSAQKVRLIVRDAVGRARDTLVVEDQPQRTYRIGSGAGGGIVGMQPLDDAPLVAFASDGSRVLRVDRAGGPPGQVAITVRALGGRILVRQTLQFEPVPVTPKTIDAVVKFLGHPGVTRAQVEAALYLPKAMPPVTLAFFLEDGRMVLRREESFGGPIRYALLNPDGSRWFDLVVPPNVVLVSGRGSKLLFLERDADGLPGYRIVEVGR